MTTNPATTNWDGEAWTALVEAMRVERKRHTLIGWNSCTCHDDSWCPPLPMHGDQRERVLAWEFHVESAVAAAAFEATLQSKCEEPMCRGGEVQYPEWEGRTEPCPNHPAPTWAWVDAAIANGRMETIPKMQTPGVIEWNGEPVYRIPSPSPGDAEK